MLQLGASSRASSAEDFELVTTRGQSSGGGPLLNILSSREWNKRALCGSIEAEIGLYL